MASEKVIKSACRMCHGVCQLLIHMEDGKVTGITGDPDSPTSQGYICPKGMASAELLYHPERLRYPLRRAGRRGENRWERITWDEALTEMSRKLTDIKEQAGPEYFALLHGTSRPYVDFANRFANAYGTPNFTNVSHLCMGARTMANVFSLGNAQLTQPDIYGFSDATPKCLVLWGSNVTGSGAVHGLCSRPVKKALEAAQHVIVIDPRRTAPAKNATHWLQLRPGTDGALALAMLHVVVQEDIVDHEFVDAYTVGYEELKTYLLDYPPEWAANITRVPAETIRAAARTYASTAPASILWGNAIDMSACSFQTARSIMILRAITGNIDRPGGDIICVTPPGVRMKSQFVNSEITGKLLLPLQQHRRTLDGKNSDVPLSFLQKTGLSLLNRVIRKFYPKIVMRSSQRPMATQLKILNKLKSPAYPLNPVVHPPKFWESIITGDPYRLKALWILGSNPLATMTNPLMIERALPLLEYIVVSEMFMTPTAQYADLVLPTTMWLEQDDVVNCLKQWCVLARRKVAQVGETRDDREVMIDLAHRLGLDHAFPWRNYHSFLTTMLQDTGLTFEEFCEKGILIGDMQYEKYKQSGFSTPSKKFEIYSETLKELGVSPLPVYREPINTPLSTPKLTKDYPLILTTGAKVRNFFHSEGRQLQMLRKGNPDPLVEIHPSTAASLGINEGEWVWIETNAGRITMRAKLFDGIAPDVVSAQHAWWFPEKSAPEYGWKNSCVNLLFGDMQYDPDTGSESLRSTLCRIYPVTGTQQN